MHSPILRLARDVRRKKRALERGWSGPALSARLSASDVAGLVRVGTAVSGLRDVHLSISELSHHIFLPGASGSGKTTTVGRLMDGFLSNDCSVVIVDCKGTGLAGTARGLARRHGVPLNVVDINSEVTLGYDPCSGDAEAIANKLVGAFTFSGDAEIYKQISMEVIPLICRAIVDAGEKVTLEKIYESLGKGAMSRLGRRDGVSSHERARLAELEGLGGVVLSGYLGMQRRLGALIEGSYGPLFGREPALNWSIATEQHQLTHISLSATAAGEDVELFGRVITQDLKQLCDVRLREIERGVDLRPVLIVYDEFAALRESAQVVDLLLQARQARISVLVATQYLPQEPSIRKPALSAGVLIVHRLEAEDAETVASQFGTHSSPLLTAQINLVTGESRLGSLRMVEEFDIHPNVLKSLPVGTAAILSRLTGWKGLVSVRSLLTDEER